MPSSGGTKRDRCRKLSTKKTIAAIVSRAKTTAPSRVRKFSFIEMRAWPDRDVSVLARPVPQNHYCKPGVNGLFSYTYASADTPPRTLVPFVEGHLQLLVTRSEALELQTEPAFEISVGGHQHDAVVTCRYR